jgi:hypothetical protein
MGSLWMMTILDWDWPKIGRKKKKCTVIDLEAEGSNEAGA